MQKTVNIHETDGGSVTGVLPADFSLYHARRDLTAKRNAEQDSVKREQINLLLGQMESFDKAEPERKASLTKAIEIQLGVIRGDPLVTNGER
jgi:hypothetical protein